MDQLVGPTGRPSSWINSCVVWTVVQPVDPTGWTNQTCQIHPTGWTKGCIVKTSIQLSGRQLDQTRLWELMKSELTYLLCKWGTQSANRIDVSESWRRVKWAVISNGWCLRWSYIFEHGDSLMEYRRNHKIQLYRIKWNHNINRNILIIFTHREICILCLGRLLICIVFFWFTHSQGRSDTLIFTLAGVLPTVGPTVGPTVTSTIELNWIEFRLLKNIKYINYNTSGFDVFVFKVRRSVPLSQVSIQLSLPTCYFESRVWPYKRSSNCRAASWAGSK